MKIAKKCCDQCPWLPNSTTVRPGRLNEIKKELLRRDCHFVCHKSIVRGGDEVVCKGGYDFHHGQLIRIAQRLDAIQFVDVETGEP